MAEHEIPFTRNDLQLQLSGDGSRLIDRFIAACEGQLKSVENIEGEEFTAMGLLSRMAQEELSTFSVPAYFYDAWNDGCKFDDRPVGADAGVLRFHGVKIVPWTREFIVANVDLTDAKHEVAIGFDVPPDDNIRLRSTQDHGVGHGG